MFKRKKCKKCNSKVGSDFSYCPKCGTKIGNEEDFGMFGKNDFEEEEFQDPLFGNFTGKMFNKMISQTFKMLEKEMEKEMRKPQLPSPQNIPHGTNFELYINGKKVSPENIKVTTQPINVQKKPLRKPAVKTSFTKEQSEVLSKLPKQEPETNIKRLSNSLIYEINIPGVKSIEDVSINQMPNSIEIKAMAKDKVYSKIIKVQLPIMNYELKNEKLLLELEAK